MCYRNGAIAGFPLSAPQRWQREQSQSLIPQAHQLHLYTTAWIMPPRTVPLDLDFHVHRRDVGVLLDVQKGVMVHIILKQIEAVPKSPR
mmetsp:Transcript_20695/g.45428  ORF Transcript_20695/g.45428 Transcript_20695/m.45428 type:complete len:89 (+) Transcript_20695:32-298(+)